MTEASGNVSLGGDAGLGIRDEEDLMGRDRRQRRRRAAAVAGVGIAAKKHHDAKQAEEQEVAPAAAQSPTADEPGPAVAPPTGGGLTPEGMERLKQLGELHEQQVLTDEEFESEKAKLLGTA